MTENTGSNPSSEETAEMTGSPAQEAATENAIDQAIVAGHEGRMTNQEVLEVIWNSELISVGRMEDENDPATFQALSLKAPDSDEKIIVTFSDVKHIPARLHDVAPFAIRNSGQVTIRSVQPGYGMAINPGITPGIELGAESIARIHEAFVEQSTKQDDDGGPSQDEAR